MTGKLGTFRNGQWFLDLNGDEQWNGCGVDGCAQFGTVGDQPVSGDWNNDQFSNIGVYRNGTWLLDLNGNDQWDGCGTDGCIRSVRLRSTGQRRLEITMVSATSASIAAGLGCWT
ncbi:MAG: hypothetical protein R3F37_19630 [Candidatus Competibacteraceae bacterium]